MSKTKTEFVNLKDKLEWTPDTTGHNISIDEVNNECVLLTKESSDSLHHKLAGYYKMMFVAHRNSKKFEKIAEKNGIIITPKANLALKIIQIYDTGKSTTTESRWAAVLNFLSEKEVELSEAAKFIEENDGVDGCEKLWKALNGNGKKKKSKKEKREKVTRLLFENPEYEAAVYDPKLGFASGPVISFGRKGENGKICWEEDVGLIHPNN